MNAIKTISALFLLSACSAACANGSSSTGSSTSNSTTASTTKAGGSAPVKSDTPVSPDELIDYRGGSSASAAADTSQYEATNGSYRVFGVEPGDGTSAPLATIAERGTWITRQYRVGDDFGRGYVVSKIDDTGVTLHGAEADVSMAIGADVDLRVIRHDLDIVAQPLGRHLFQVRTLAAKAALDTVRTRPSLTAQTLYSLPMQQLGDVAPGSLWAGADFQAGDLIATIDGKPVDDQALALLETGLTDGRPKLDVTVYRGGVSLNRSYQTAP